MSAFKEGDVVTLKSGGPKMTVEEVKGNHPDWFHATYYLVTCVWYEDQKFNRQEFKDSLLEPYRGR